MDSKYEIWRKWPRVQEHVRHCPEASEWKAGGQGVEPKEAGHRIDREDGSSLDHLFIHLPPSLCPVLLTPSEWHKPKVVPDRRNLIMSF